MSELKCGPMAYINAIAEKAEAIEFLIRAENEICVLKAQVKALVEERENLNYQLDEALDV